MIRNFITLLLVLSVASTAITQAQNNDKALTGVIELEEEKVQRNDYYSNQEEAIQFYTGFLNQLEQKNPGQVSLNDSSLNYLTAVYLYCMVNNGTCPWMLDAIVEVDIVNSKLSNKVQCPLLKRFWNQWVKNNFEERHKYLVQTAYIAETGRYLSQGRVKYLRCEELVRTELGSINESASAFFKSRYSQQSLPLSNVKKLHSYISGLKDSRRNVLNEMGAGGQGPAVFQQESGSQASPLAAAPKPEGKKMRVAQ